MLPALLWGRLAATVVRCSGWEPRVLREPCAIVELLWEPAGEEVRHAVTIRVKGRETHEQDKAHRTRNGNRRMAEEKAPPPVAAGTQSLTPGPGCCL